MGWVTADNLDLDMIRPPKAANLKMEFVLQPFIRSNQWIHKVLLGSFRPASFYPAKRALYSPISSDFLAIRTGTLS